MFLAKLSIDRPIMVTMGLMVFIIFGIISFNKLNISNVPEVNIPFVTISTIYPGAGPKEIETQISKKIEDAVSTVSEIKRVESYSLDGISIVMIEFKLSKDINIAVQETKDKVDEIVNNLPIDAKKPIIQKVDLQAFPIIDIVFSGDLPPKEMYDIADKLLQDRLSQITGVAKVNIVGGQEREIRINFDDKTIFEKNISMPQLLQIIKAHNFSLPGGYFQINGQEYTVRADGDIKSLNELRNLIIPTPYGNKRLSELANVEDAGKTVRQRAVYFDNLSKSRNENVVRLSIIKGVDGNPVNISKELKKILPELEKLIPKGTTLTVVNDDSEFTQSTIDDTMSNIYLGVLFTALILLLFLHDLRSTIIIALSMPTSVISTFWLMDLAGFSINMMSLMGISVSVGVLVSNSIVVLENIFRHKEMGYAPKDAAYIGAKEVFVAVIAATLTNIVVFVPLANISSLVGEFLQEMALTATFATIMSLIMSFTLTPMLASLIIPDKPKLGKFSQSIIKFEKIWEKLYDKILRIVLKNGWVALGILVLAFVAFVGSLIIYGSKLGFEFMPTQDNGKIRIDVKLPEGYDLSSTTKVLKTIEDRVSQYKDVEKILTNIGKTDELNTGTNLGMLEVYLNKVDKRNNGMNDFINVFNRDLADIPNAEIKIMAMENMAGPGAPIEFYLLGQDLNKLEEIKLEIEEKCKNIKGLINFDNSSSAGKPEITIRPKREKLSEVGITAQDLALTIRTAMEGLLSTQFKDRGEEYDITITLNEEATNTPEKIGLIPIITPMGSFRLAQLADITFTTGFTKVLRRDKFTAIKFTGDAAQGIPTGDIINEINKIIEGERQLDGTYKGGLELPPGYRIKWGGTSEMQIEMVQDLGFAFFLAIILTYMLLAAILESFWQPVLILLTLPMALIGVVILMYYTDTNFGLTALMGVIMLIGIVVNNAILLLDFANQLVREEKISLKEALIKAGPVKLKPIIMTTVAIILGLAPMALGFGDVGKEMRIPLGIVSVGGLVASTALTLIVIPTANYFTDLLFNKFRNLFKKK